MRQYTQYLGDACLEQSLVRSTCTLRMERKIVLAELPEISSFTHQKVKQVGLKLFSLVAILRLVLKVQEKCPRLFIIVHVFYHASQRPHFSSGRHVHVFMSSHICLLIFRIKNTVFNNI